MSARLVTPAQQAKRVMISVRKEWSSTVDQEIGPAAIGIREDRWATAIAVA